MPSTETSINLLIVNRLSVSLTFNSPTSIIGSPPTPSTPAVAPNGAINITANGMTGCAGSFQLVAEGYVLSINYSVNPEGGPANIALNLPMGVIGEFDAPGYPGTSITPHLNLYNSIPSGKDGGCVVPLGVLANPPFENGQDFSNSMFGPNIRSASQISATPSEPCKSGYVMPADFTGGQLAGAVAVFLDQWQGTETGICNSDDIALLDFLKNYIVTASPSGPLTLWLPTMASSGNAEPISYLLSGYMPMPFIDAGNSWNSDTVTCFLTLLLGGGHFVAICAKDDLPSSSGSVTPMDEMLKSSALTIKHDIGNSHYTSLVNVTGTYYLNISSDFSPPDCGLILSFLTGRTVNNPLARPGDYNSFFQLEGWPYSIGSKRHTADYETYTQTLWNISTYGACPYSEKRGTTLFLAPAGWTPTVYQTTRMAPYVGAYAKNPSNPAPQAWLNTQLVEIPSTAPALPARYFDSK
ncbi:MAG: hypothetical protein EON54_17630 [Alcaligenaceae bacterium]|nr:MAG: hypothetical protein EON54_17630 [Alcaligenaceae bacterium]